MAVSFESPEYTADVDALGTLRILEAIRLLGLEKKTKFYQASTSELYGLVQETPQTETTPFYPRSPYAVAKIAGIKMCESYNRQYGRDYRSVMPTNLYGAHDNFHPENSHVIPALLRRFHEAVAQNAAEITIWGSGAPMREFLHVDDMAAASVFVMELSREAYGAQTDPMLSHINVGTGVDCTIRDLAEAIAAVTGFIGRLVFDHTKPDGAPRKLMDTSKLNAFGWSPTIGLREGLQSSYEWFVANQDKFRG